MEVYLSGRVKVYCCSMLKSLTRQNSCLISRPIACLDVDAVLKLAWQS